MVNAIIAILQTVSSQYYDCNIIQYEMDRFGGSLSIRILLISRKVVTCYAETGRTLKHSIVKRYTKHSNQHRKNFILENMRKRAKKDLIIKFCCQFMKKNLAIEHVEHGNSSRENEF